MKKPNLFIMGAPKCGTTSMVEWLSDHPEIYFSPIKEPHYYNTDHSHNVVTNYNQYLNLFKNASENHKIIAEASVWYLYSYEAIRNIILDSSQDNKYIVMLRNPIEMAYSLHEQQVFNLNEPQKDFKRAWFLQEDRKENKSIAITTRDAKLLLYGEVCKLGKQVNRLLQYVEKKNVKFLILDDIKNDPTKVFDEVLEFLNVSTFVKTDFKAVNTAKVRKSKNIALLVKLLGRLKRNIGITKGFGILNKSNQLNVSNIKRVSLCDDMKKILQDYFKEDVKLLSKVIDKDLSCWL